MKTMQKKTTVINRDSVTDLREEIMTALKPVMAKHGLQAMLGRITFEVGKEFRGKLTVIQPATDVKAGEKPKVGETWHFGRKSYRIVEVGAGDVIGVRWSNTRKWGRIERRFRIKLWDITLNGVKVA
jgi:hypothetical protein